MSDVLESVVTAVIDRVLAREGGVADVGDGAGVTRYGQTKGWLERWRLPVPNSPADAAMNYRSWLEQTDLDALCTVDDVLCDIGIDFAVHSGEREAIAALQRALRRDGATAVLSDGVLGPVTMTALARCNRPRMACQVLADRLQLDLGLIHSHPETYAQFANGWGQRLADLLRRIA